MKQNNLLQDLEMLFNSFTSESLNEIKDYDSLHSKLENGVSAYLNFIETTYPLKEMAGSILSKNSKSLKLSNVNDLYQSRVLGNNSRLGSIDVLSKKISGIAEFHKLLVTEAKRFRLDDEWKYLVLKDEFFIYNNSKLEVNAGTHAYSFLKVIYEYFSGQSGEISYEQLAEEVRKNKRYKKYSDKKVKDTLQKYITTKAKGELGDKFKSVEANGRPLIETIKSFGIRFNNG